ncbi:hypothetical protein GCM10009091_43760 [Pseudomonas brenneri]|uniref:Uncharacterized protein n=1 Tax=Pseudomonas brenneri TaxID=129817 RepID=A0A5B2UNQ5_9PSED|nr:hypothetical protein [Pseudomonas brenneri]KAA2227549.1 hypothetical protein F1720_21945 [Pseudomonas brenneri]TWR75282.1 hypothetical protein FJD34_24130 [Pseudomonas brenneri]GGL57530.1 hypothetical protein GCM10009091_43760 [Pseudomonas brenneri]
MVGAGHWPSPTVGASLLAKGVNDNACLLGKRGVSKCFASKLAPTEGLSSEQLNSLHHHT